jgi:hypothetical protein
MRLAPVVALLACGPAHRSDTTPPRAPPPKSLAFTGSHVEDATVSGYVTLVDFWSESCAACTIVGGRIAVKIANDDRVIVRKVDVGDGLGPISQAYNVSALPHWNVYDTKRRLRFILVGPDCLRAPDLAAELLAEP